MRIPEAEKILLDENQPIAKRMDAAFTLKSFGSAEAVRALAKGFTSSSNLLTHEIAYVLGQMKLKEATAVLENVLLNSTEHDSITRHEAAEALAAIGQQSSVSVLRKFVYDPIPEVAQTCVLALDTLESKKKPWTRSERFCTEDPAPLSNERSLEGLAASLLDSSKGLFERYSALFRLREIGNSEAVAAICKGFSDNSALYKHEIAYVLGQIMNCEAIDALEKVLRDKSEHPMVRHEAAEAMGAISGDRAKAVLKEFTMDESRIVGESCLVALDMADFWTRQEGKS